MIRLAVRCDPESAELVLAELLHLAPGGVEEERGPGWVEYAIYGAPGELPALGHVEALAGEASVTVTSEEIPDDWADRWRDFHEAVLIADRVLVRPSWLESPALPDPGASGGEAAPTGDLVEVVVDPGQAFGTGAHPTTRLCVELLVALAERGGAEGSLADLGTGSGVLAIAAAKLGFSPVLAIDHEPAALEAAAANAEANGVMLETRRINLREADPPDAATIVANLTAPLLHELAGRLAEPPRTLICSGLLPREAEGVAGAFARAGLIESERRSSGEWCAIAFGAP